MPHALLLSPDDQAVSAITAVLEEMSVTCERPLDGVSAAQKLNSQSFDLVLVDCENLPAAKLIFDVCRRGKNGNNPVPIAIVDGRAGLPTAFRLGAELILTKPVAKDQARTTIRTAVGRVRKDVAANESVSAQPANAAAPGPIMTPVMTMTEERPQAAAAAASSQLTGFADPVPSFSPLSLSTAASSPSTLSAPSHPPKANMSVDEMEATAASSKLKQPLASISDSHLSESSSASAAAVNSKPKLPLSDDPVLAELERTELEESEVAETRQAESQKQKLEPTKTAPDRPTPKSDAPVFSSYPRGRQKPRGALVASLILALAGSGFYVAWTYQPGFRAISQPQIDRVLELTGVVRPSSPASNPVKPSAQPAATTVSVSAPGTPTDPSKTPSTAPDSATNSATDQATSSPTTSAAAPSQAQPATTPDAAVASTTSRTTTAAAPAATQPAVSKTSDGKPGDSKPGDNKNKKDTAVAASPDAPLPGESSVIILSSKGAEKRLAHSVQPKYPVEAHSGQAQGTVVLKEVVDESGKVAGVRLVEGNPALATAAISAVKQWRYRPYERDGKAQPFQTVVIIDFQRP